MRIAFLSATKTLEGDSMAPAGFARIGGRSILQRHLDIALTLGCERIVCLSNELPSQLIQLQHDAEAAGAQFQVIRGTRMLSNLVHASDEVLVISDGLICDNAIAVEASNGGKCILTLAAKDAVAAGFERIDSDRAWAGLMLIGGSLIERLAELPEDVDPVSTLLRIALQSGTRTGLLDSALLADQKWVLVQSEDDARALSELWLKGTTKISSVFAPISALADISARAVLGRHSEPVQAAVAGRILSATLLGVAGICAWFVQPLAGFAATLLAVFSSKFANTVTKAISKQGSQSRWKSIRAQLQPLTVDTVIILLIGVSVPSALLAAALFAAIVVIGLMRIVENLPERAFPKTLVEAASDRSTLALFCMTSVLLGKLVVGIQLVAVILLVLILVQTYRVKLTAA